MRKQTAQNPFKQKQKRNQLLLIATAATALMVIGALITLYISSQQTGILILDQGSDITIRLNGKEVKSQLQQRGLFVPVYSGNYRLQIDKPQYQSFITDVVTEPGKVAEVRPAFTLVPSVKEEVGDAVDFVQPSFDEKYVYYLGDFRQRLYRYDVANQQSLALTRKPLERVGDVRWGQNLEVALVVQPDGVYLHEIPTFNFVNQVFERVASNEFISPVWDPQNSNRIAAAYFGNAGERSLVTTDKRFSNIKRLTDLTGIPRPAISWSPDGSYLLIRGTGPDVLTNNLWIFKLETGTLTQLTTTGGVTFALFNPDSTSILVESELSSDKQRSIIPVSGGSATSILSAEYPGTATWKDANSFFEPVSEGNLQLVTVGGTTTRFAVTLPNPEDITSLFYVDAVKRLIFATKTAVYSISLEKL
jgi:hypothetical protein